MLEESTNIRLVRLIRLIRVSLCLRRVRIYSKTYETNKTYRSFPMFDESKDIRLVRLIRLIFWRRVRT
jgi:hypothetical protein